MSVLNKELDVCRIQKHQAFQKRFLPLAESAVENIQKRWRKFSKKYLETILQTS